MLLAELTTTPPALAKMVPKPCMTFRSTLQSRAWLPSFPTKSTPDCPTSLKNEALTVTAVELLPITTPQPPTARKLQFVIVTPAEFDTATAASCGIPGSLCRSLKPFCNPDETKSVSENWMSRIST